MSEYGNGIGVKAEELVKELIQSSGWGVKELRKASDEGRAPLLENDNSEKDLRLVDLQVHHPDWQTQYVEVKAKQKPIKYGIEDEMRHGFEKDQYDDYTAFANGLTDCPVHIFIYEEERGVILRKRVRNLSVVQEADPDYADGKMVYFKREFFETVTDDISQFTSAFGQSGIVENDIDLNPFGLRSNEQAGLSSFATEGDDD